MQVCRQAHVGLASCQPRSGLVLNLVNKAAVEMAACTSSYTGTTRIMMQSCKGSQIVPRDFDTKAALLRGGG